MKRTLLFFSLLIFFVFTFMNRYQPIALEKAKPTLMQVEIKGAVKNPGVYTLKWKDTVQSLIQASGGLLENAEDSTISYAQVLQDKDVVVIREKSKAETPLVSINASSQEELETLPGIGPAIAKRIIEYRKIQTFQTLEQIKEVKGIGDALFEKIKERICL